MNTIEQKQAGQAAHTPFALPLEISTDTLGRTDICEAGAGDMVADLVGIDNAEQKAAFIARACNSHAALVAALEASAQAHENTAGRFERVATVAFGDNGISERTMNDIHAAKAAILQARAALAQSRQ